MDFDWKKLEREDAERWGRNILVGILYFPIGLILIVVLLATGNFEHGWMSVAMPILLLGIPALIVWFRRRRQRNELK